MGGILDNPQRRYFAGVLPVTLLMLLSVIACFMVLTFSLGARCAADAAMLMPPYPEATLEAETYSYLRPFGVGTTTQSWLTTDRASDVRRHYIDAERAAAEQGRTVSRSPADFSRQIIDLREGGTRIRLSAACAVAFDLSPVGIGGQR